MALPTRRAGPFAELADLQSRFDRMFEGLMERGTGAHAPAVDVIDEDDAIVVRADVPGMTPEEVKVEVQDDVLTVRGGHEETTEEKDKRYVRRERRYGGFMRSIPLPSRVDPGAITATCKDGVVEVRIPHEKQEEPTTIAVTPGS